MTGQRLVWFLVVEEPRALLIGVIKVLEEVGIRPDYITGTSMGSIIGGLYSIGYTATELDSIVSTADWAHLLSDRVPLLM